jgi:hypothetical protein
MRVLALAAALLALVAATAPRELVYAYSFECDRSGEVDKGYGVDKMDPGGGGTFLFHNVNQHYRSPSFDGPQSRSGKIAVRVLREQAGGGLVLEVSEVLAPHGATDPVTCVAFGDTTVVCDPSREVNPEVSMLLATLGKDFVDPSRLDAARHWRIDPHAAYGTIADYSIVRSAGTMLEISESGIRTRSGSPLKATLNANIEYDAARSLPISLEASTVEQIRGGVVSETISTHTALKLESDTTPK